MQILRLGLFTLFALGLLYVLHEQAQTGRYVSSPDGTFITDSQTGATFTAARRAGGPTPQWGLPIR